MDDDDPMDDAAFRPAVDELGGGGRTRSPLPVLVAEPRRLGAWWCWFRLCRPQRTSSSKDLKRSQARTGGCCLESRTPVDGIAVLVDAFEEDAAASPFPKAGRLPILVVPLALLPGAPVPAVPVPKPPLRPLPRLMPLLDEWFPLCWLCC